MMETNRRQNLCTVNFGDIISSCRRYKTMRNNSMPDLQQLKSTSPLKPSRLQYNKWFIRPEQRLKKSINTLRSSFQLQSHAEYFYESLYKQNQSEVKRVTQQEKDRVKAIQKICSDSQNLKLLTTFRNRKQQTCKRVPAVVDYIITFHNRLQKQEKTKVNRLNKRITFAN